ncbi:MAG: PhoH family protein, partial [Opitutales bacterium]|nr:PhoH family protein [Opitutales bacterium]
MRSLETLTPAEHLEELDTVDEENHSEMTNSTPKVYVLDTNVLLHDPESISKFQEHTVVLPSEVLVEMDRKKTAEGQLGANARRVHRVLRDLFDARSLSECAKGENMLEADMPNGGRLRLVITSEKDFSSEELSRLSAVLIDRNQTDHRILAAAYNLKRHDPNPVILVSKDANMALKGKLLGLPVEDYRNDRVPIVENEGYREIVVDSPTFEALANYEWDDPDSEGFPLEVPEDAYVNEYFLIRASEECYQGIVEPVRFIGDGLVDMLPLYRQHLRQDVNRSDKNGLQMPNGIRVIPRNVEQWIHMDALMNPEITLVTCKGKAGTGKTFLAMACALHEVLSENSHYQRLLISRPIVDMGRGIGYLPGTKEEKMGPYMQPYFDNLEVLFPNRRSPRQKNNTNGQTPPLKVWERFQQQGILEIEALTYIRGRSIPNSLLIVDEAQNLTPHEVKTVVTRLAHGSKLILLGDPHQIDNPFLDNRTNGLVYARDRLKGQEIAIHTKLVEGVRSEIAELGA